MQKVIVALFIFLSLASTALAREANVILKDGRIVKGELIGLSGGVIYVKNEANKAESIQLITVSEVFDAATGEKISTGAAEGPKVEIIKSEPTLNAPPAAVAVKPKPNQTMLFFYGTMQSGLVAYQPCTPLEGTFVPYSAYVIGSQPFDSAWGAGMSLEYKLFDSLAACFDMGISRWEKLLAKQNGYGVGDWVWEQNGYTDARVGPFPMDVKYYMDTTSMRLGGKYFFMEGPFQPWVGASLGFYAWQATIGNRELEKKYSDISSDTAVSTSFQLGIDFVFGDFALRIFGDFATAVAHTKFENLFQPGWTFESDQHVEGPYRFGIALGFGM